MEMNVPRSVAEILKDGLSNLQEIARLEVRLAKAELREELALVRNVAIVVGAGVVTALLAWGFICLTLLYLLTLAMPHWAAALVIACMLTVLSWVCIAFGLRRFKSLTLTPKTINNMKKDVQWVKHPTE